MKKDIKTPNKTATTEIGKYSTSAPVRSIGLGRRSPSEFPCEIENRDALLVEESLDERERRG